MKYLIFVILFLLPFYRSLEIFIGGVGVSLIDFLILLAAPASLLFISNKRRVSKSLAVALSGLILAVVMSAIFNGLESHQVIYTISLGIKFVLLIEILTAIRTDRERLTAMSVIAVSAGIVATLSIFQQLFSIGATGEIVSVAGTYSARNEMLHFAVPALFFTLFFSLTSKYKYIYMVIFAVQLISIFSSRGRIGLFIASFGSLFLYYLIEGFSWNKGLRLLLFVTFIIFIGYEIFSPVIADFKYRYLESMFAESSEERGSAFIRTVVTQGLWNAWLDSPFFGIGPGSFLHKSNQYVDFISSDFVQPHNTYLGLLAETGVLGLISFVSMPVSAILATRYAVPRLQSNQAKLLMVSFVSFIASFLILIGFDGLLRYPTWVFIGLLFSFYPFRASGKNSVYYAEAR